MFTSEENAAMLAFLIGILPSCSAIHQVIEGDGFIKGARLATVTAMALQTPRPRDFYVYESLSKAFEGVRAMHGVDMTEAVLRPPSGSEEPRASGAFRAAARLFDDKPKK